MAKFSPPIIIQDRTGWHLMHPSNPWEALRIAWLMWRHPKRVAALIGVGIDYPAAHWTAAPSGAAQEGAAQAGPQEGADTP